MKSWVVQGYKQDLQQQQVAEPTLGRRDVLVQVAAAGLNQLDEKIRLGEFRQILRYRAPFVLGHDVAGAVVAVGDGVSRFAPGDEVWAKAPDGRIGTFAERIAIIEDAVSHAPRSLSITEAAAMPLVALTAWQVLVERANVQPGQRVLVHAGAGGVGTIAIQLAKHLGAEVAATVGGRNVELVEQLGADIVVDYKSSDFSKLRGFDLVLDSVGGDNLLRSFSTLRRGGRVVGIAGPPDPTFAKSQGLNPVLQLAIRGLSAKVRREARSAGVDYGFLFMRHSGEQLEQLSSLFDSGVLRPVVGKVGGFDDIPRLLAGTGAAAYGKTVAVVQ